MRTIIPYKSLRENSWAEDLTPSQEIRQSCMYVQCMGHYSATTAYGVIGREHLHSYLYLYTNEGSGILSYKGREVKLPTGCSAVLDCDLPHSYYCDPEQNWDFYWIHFSGSCIDGYLSEIIDNWDICHQGSADIFYLIYDESRASDNIIHAIQSSTALIDLCSALLVELKQNQQSRGNTVSPIIKNAIFYLEEHITQELRLDDLCAALDVSKFYLSHLFKEQTGFSPYEYLITLRLSYAKSLLRSTQEPVSVIAEKAEFGGSSYFIQLFRKREQITPLQYRNYFLHLSSV